MRPGYRPPEDVEVYKNRTAEAWKNRGIRGAGGVVPGAEGLNLRSKTETGSESQDGNRSTKNAKRRKARRRAMASAEVDGDEGRDGDGDEDGDGDGEEIPAVDGGVPLDGSPQAPSSNKLAPADKEHWRAASESDPVAERGEREKQVRTLKKKLRQARELCEKKDNGESLLPEQFEKVIKINELIRQLDSLGFNADGEPKRDRGFR